MNIILTGKNSLSDVWIGSVIQEQMSEFFLQQKITLLFVATVTETEANVRTRCARTTKLCRFSNSQITAVHKQHEAHTLHTTTACLVPTSGVMLVGRALPPRLVYSTKHGGRARPTSVILDLCQVVTAFNSAGPSRAKMLLDASTIRDIQSGCF